MPCARRPPCPPLPKQEKFPTTRSPLPAGSCGRCRIIAAATVVGLLYVGRPVLLPIVLSVFLFYALDPLVDRLESWRVPRGAGFGAGSRSGGGRLAAGAVALWPQFETVVTRVPEAARQLNRTLRTARAGTSGDSAFTKVQEAVKAIDEAAAASSTAPSLPRGTLRVEVADTWRVSDALWAGSLGMVGLMGQTVSVLFLTIFLLVEDDAFKRKLVRRMESIGSKRVTVQVLKDVARQIEQFLWVQALTSAGVAVVTGFGLWWMGVENPAIWGVFAGLMNLVPFFGPLIVTVVVGAVAFLQFGSLREASLVAGMTIVITTLEGNFITPQLLSRTSSLNLVAMFVAIAFWSWVWGVAGMLLAVPILMAVKVVCDRVEGGEALAEFLRHVLLERAGCDGHHPTVCEPTQARQGRASVPRPLRIPTGRPAHAGGARRALAGRPRAHRRRPRHRLAAGSGRLHCRLRPRHRGDGVSRRGSAARPDGAARPRSVGMAARKEEAPFKFSVRSENTRAGRLFWQQSCTLCHDRNVRLNARCGCHAGGQR